MFSYKGSVDGIREYEIQKRRYNILKNHSVIITCASSYTIHDISVIEISRGGIT